RTIYIEPLRPIRAALSAAARRSNELIALCKSDYLACGKTTNVLPAGLELPGIDLIDDRVK
ncbi:MAG TPA: hypothetical protein VF467_16935, partial [Afipia sp.]